MCFGVGSRRRSAPQVSDLIDTEGVTRARLLTAVRKLDRLSDSEDGPGWLFPGRRTRGMISEGIPAGHADVGLLNGYLGILPGVSFSPHCVRYAFSTYGERDLGFRKSEAKVILDHMEGTEPDDVTGKFYSSDPAIRRKREMMTLWVDWLDEWCAKAIAADPMLSDHEAYAERWVKSVKDECLSKIILFGERSVRRALSEYVQHYHAERNSQGKSNVLLFRRVTQTRREEPVQCRERLGGLLRYYHQEAA